MAVPRTFGIFALLFLLVMASTSSSYAQAEAEVEVEVELLLSAGILDYAEGHFEDAKASLLRAHELNPKHVEVLYYLGLTYLALEDSRQAAQSLEEARGLAPENLDIRQQLGVAYLSAGEHDKAEVELRFVQEKEPRRENLGFFLGSIAFRRGEFEKALDLFRQNVSTDPEFQQLAGYYLGLSLERLGRAKEAEEAISQAVQVSPTTPVGASAQKFLETLSIRRREEEKRLVVSATFNVQYDDNVVAAPTENVFGLRERERRSAGELFFLRGDYAFVKTRRWEGSFAYAFLQTINHDVEGFDIQDHYAALSGLRRGVMGKLRYQVGLQGGFDYAFLSGSSYLKRSTVTPYLTLFGGRETVSTIEYRLRAKDFTRTIPDPANDQDAINHMFGVVHFIRLAGGRHFLKFGYQFDVEAAEGRNFDYLGHKLLGGFQVSFPLEVLLAFHAELHFRDYLHNNMAFGVERRDFEQTYLLTIARKLPFDNLTLALEYLATLHGSNIAVFDFTRNVVSLGMRWQY